MRCATFVNMLVKLGPLVTEVAGSMGGMTMQRSPNGTVARTKPLPIRRQGTYSADARQRLASLNMTWRTLTILERSDWDTFAGTVSWYNRFGDPVTGTGYMAFLKCNMASHHSAGTNDQVPFQTTYPLTTAGALPAAPEFVYDLATDTLLLTSTDSDMPLLGGAWLFASQPFSAGRRFNHRPMPYMRSAQADKPLPKDLTAAYLKVWGRLPDKNVSESAFLRVQSFDEQYLWPGPDVTLPLVYK